MFKERELIRTVQIGVVWFLIPISGTERLKTGVHFSTSR